MVRVQDVSVRLEADRDEARCRGYWRVLSPAWRAIARRLGERRRDSPTHPRPCAIRCQASGGRGAPSGRHPREGSSRPRRGVRRQADRYKHDFAETGWYLSPPPILGLANLVSSLRWAGRPVRLASGATRVTFVPPCGRGRRCLEDHTAERDGFSPRHSGSARRRGASADYCCCPAAVVMRSFCTCGRF
jgi:hypothetical protein